MQDYELIRTGKQAAGDSVAQALRDGTWDLVATPSSRGEGGRASGRVRSVFVAPTLRRQRGGLNPRYGAAHAGLKPGAPRIDSVQAPGSNLYRLGFRGVDERQQVSTAKGGPSAFEAGSSGARRLPRL